MNTRVVGSILMILGTSIGAGMLALPVVTAPSHIIASALGLVVAWIVMTIGAISILEVNLWHAPDSNFITMAKNTLGRYGQFATWVIYLLLLYSLICAYLSGLSDLLQALLLSAHRHIPRWVATFIALLAFGGVVYRGITSIDIVNRGLMTAKLIIFIVLVALVIPHIQSKYLAAGDYHFHSEAFMVMLTSFGFATIIPSLRSYLNSDRRALIKTVLIGSLMPLILYLVWVFVIQGILPRLGADGLLQMMSSSSTNSELMHAITHTISSSEFSDIANFFVSICAMTSFLGVSLCLVDFVADGLALHKKGYSGFKVFAITYVPPLLIVLFWPGVFIHALAYAGICCLLLLIIIPLLMLYVGRYRKHYDHIKILPGGKWVIGLTLLAIVAFLIFN